MRRKKGAPTHACSCLVCDFARADCKWLNTCVGGSNYRLFFSSMSFALVLLTYQLGLGLFLFVSSFRSDAFSYAGHTSAEYIRQAYGHFSAQLFQALVGIMLAISTPLVLALLQLFGLHVYLWQRGITTYEVRQ